MRDITYTIAEYFVIDDIEFPNIFENRAAFARNSFIRNPAESMIDGDGLVWCRYDVDGVWYSIAGNYSGYSPKEKIQVRLEREAEHERRMQTAQEIYKHELYKSQLRIDVLERDKYTCQRCGKVGTTRFHVHHILKRKEGGLDLLDNLITVCPSCHPKVDNQEYNPAWVDPDEAS